MDDDRIENDLIEEVRPRLGRWLVGTLIILIAWGIVGSLISLAVAFLLNLDLAALYGTDDASLAITATYPPWKPALAILVAWAPLLAATVLLHRFLLGLNLKSLFTRSSRSFSREILVGALVMFLIIVATTLPDFYLNQVSYTFTFDAARFFPYLLIAIFWVPLQSGAEEIFFRGWIQLRLEKAGRSIWIVSILSGAIFALPHLQNPEVNGELFFAILGYGSTGFMFGWVTMRDKSIGIAIGAHAINNLFVGLVVATADSALPSASIWTTPEVAWQASALFSLLIVPIFIWLTKRMISKVAS